MTQAHDQRPPPLLLDLVECVGIWAGRQTWYPTRRRRAAHATASPPRHGQERQSDAPTPARPLQPSRLWLDNDGRAVALVRPYVLAHPYVLAYEPGSRQALEPLPESHQHREGAPAHA